MNNVEIETDVDEKQWYVIYEQSEEEEEAPKHVDSVLKNIDPDSSNSDIHFVNDDQVIVTPLLDQKSIENLQTISNDEPNTFAEFAEFPMLELPVENERENFNMIEEPFAANPVDDDEDEGYEDTLSETTDNSSRAPGRSEFVENAVFPFVTGVSLGTLLTICGLSLIYMHSDISNTDVRSAHNISPQFKSSLERIFSDSHFQENISTMLIDDMLVTKFCERHNSKDCSRRKRFKSKLKTTERKIRQMIRGNVLKAIRNKYGTTKKNYNMKQVLEENVFTNTYKDDVINSTVKMEESNVFFGPVTEEEYKEEIIAVENVESINYIDNNDISIETCDILENTCSKDDVENDEIDLEQVCFEPQLQNEEILDCSPINPNAQNNDFLMKDYITSRATSTDEMIGADTEYRKLYNTFIELEDEYRRITYNESDSSLRSRIQEMKKTMSVPLEDRYALENRLNHMKEDTEKIASIIEKQTKLMYEFSQKANQKMRSLKLRRTIENNMNTRLYFVKNKENKLADELKNDNSSNMMDNRLITEVISEYPTETFGQKIVDELIVTAVQNGNISSMSDASSSTLFNDIEDVKTMEQELRQLKEKSNEYPYKPYGLSKTILAEKMARKMDDEEHVWFNTSNIEKCDSRNAWTKTRNEFHKM